MNRKIFYCKPEDPGEYIVGSPKYWRNDPKYMELVRKGAFDKWVKYQAYRSGNLPEYI
jgi:hypothetical protein